MRHASTCLPQGQIEKMLANGVWRSQIQQNKTKTTKNKDGGGGWQPLCTFVLFHSFFCSGGARKDHPTHYVVISRLYFFPSHLSLPFPLPPLSPFRRTYAIPRYTIFQTFLISVQGVLNEGNILVGQASMAVPPYPPLAAKEPYHTFIVTIDIQLLRFFVCSQWLQPMTRYFFLGMYCSAKSISRTMRPCSYYCSYHCTTIVSTQVLFQLRLQDILNWTNLMGVCPDACFSFFLFLKTISKEVLTSPIYSHSTKKNFWLLVWQSTFVSWFPQIMVDSSPLLFLLAFSLQLSQG